MEQAAEAYRNLQWLKQQTEDKERNALREKDIIISQLQSALQSRSQETQVPHSRLHVCYCCNQFQLSAAPPPVQTDLCYSFIHITGMLTRPSAAGNCLRVFVDLTGPDG